MYSFLNNKYGLKVTIKIIFLYIKLNYKIKIKYII